jgi:hypothetical protein
VASRPTECPLGEHVEFSLEKSVYAFGPCQVILKGIRVDDWVFGVSSVGKDGFESPVASAVPGGAFHPYIASEKK